MSMCKTDVPGVWQRYLDEFENYLKLRGLRSSTIKTRIDWVRRFARDCMVSPVSVRAADVGTYAAAHDWRPETRRSVYASLRLFYRFMLEVEHVATDPTTFLPRVKPSEPKPRPAPRSAINDALSRCDERTTLILHLAAFAGLRRAEICQIHARDVIEDILGYSLIVHGKGGKQRIIPLDDGLAADLRRATRDGFAFPGNCEGHLSPRYVGKLATRVLPDSWTLHTLRHRFASAAYASSNDLLAVQTLLGHASPATTRRYVQVPDERLRAVATGARAA